jgi:hypothetical protein
MGTAHVLMHPNLIKRIEEQYPKQIKIVEMLEFGDGLVSCRVQSKLLPMGYQGMMELAIIDGQLRFKREHDT